MVASLLPLPLPLPLTLTLTLPLTLTPNPNPNRYPDQVARDPRDQRGGDGGRRAPLEADHAAISRGNSNPNPKPNPNPNPNPHPNPNPNPNPKTNPNRNPNRSPNPNPKQVLIPEYILQSVLRNVEITPEIEMAPERRLGLG